MKNPTGDEKDSIKAELMASSTTKTLNGYVVKGNITSSSSLSSSSGGNRQSSSDSTTNGNWTGRDTNNSNSILSGPISGNYLESKMNFSSITDVNKQLFLNSASSFTSSNDPPIQKQMLSNKTKKNLNGIGPMMTLKSAPNNQQQACDQNSNNNHSSLLPDTSKFPSSSLRSFSSQIDSTLRGSEYLESVTHHQHNYQQKPDSQSLNHLQQQQQQSNEFQVWYAIQFRRLCQLCLVMPLIGLVGCLIIACIFQFSDIQETACKVYNLVPSISAITGISPGRYLWRVCIAFHLGPRLIIVATYYHFLLSFAPSLSIKGCATRLTSLLNYCFYLQIVEILSLCTISFIHNREHYPIHQKGFIFYICSSHLSFFLILKIYHVIWPALNDLQKCSYRNKLCLFILSLTCMALMAYYYYRHFIHCDPFAFSIFAFAEYIVAVANMGYYWTIVDDLPTEQIVVIRPGIFPSQTAMPNASNACTESQPKSIKTEDGIPVNMNATTINSTKDKLSDQGLGKENSVNEMGSLQNGIDLGLKKRLTSSSRMLPSDAHYNMSDASSNENTDVKANGCIPRPVASLRSENYNVTDKNKQE